MLENKKIYDSNNFNPRRTLSISCLLIFLFDTRDGTPTNERKRSGIP